MEQKPAPCASFFSYRSKKVCVVVVQMPPHVEGQRLLACSDRSDKAKSRRFSKSKSVYAGWSGNVPRLCAIWTPQCGGMKGKLCFIKRKSKILISNGRIFCEKNVSFFEHRERPNENLWTFLRNFPSFLFFLPIFWGKRRTLLPHPCHSPFLPPQLRTRGRTRPCASRTQRVRNSCLHPSPSPAIH